MELIKIFVADDHQLFIEGIKALTRDSQEVKLIGEAENGEDLLDQLKTNVPDVILMDINMPKINGIEATKKIRQLYLATSINLCKNSDHRHADIFRYHRSRLVRPQ